jgi:hypothetical protein
MSRRILLLFLTTSLAVVLGFWSFTPVQAVALLKNGGYWMILTSFVCFAIVVVRSLRDTRAEIVAWRGWIGPVAIAMSAAVFLHLHENHEFKIVADEVVMQLTAKQMHFAREVAVVVRGYEYAGNFEPLVTYVDKRPLLFPFLLATLHDFTGFRITNVYLVNGLLSGLMMVLLLLIGRKTGGWGAGLAAVLLMATVPLVAQNACGSGFEILNMVMILSTIWLGMRAGERPTDDDRLGAFVLSGVLLAQVRYESALFVVPVAAVVVYLWWRQRTIRLPWPLLLAPLLLIPCPLLLNVFKLSASAWQLGDIAGADKPFGLRYFYDNVGHALNFFLSVGGAQPNSIIVGVLGSLGVGFFVLVLFRNYRSIASKQPEIAVLCILLVGLLLHAFMMLCYFWGRWDDLVVQRLSLPTHLLLVLALVYIWPQLIAYRRRWTLLCSAALVYLVSFTVPSNAMHRPTKLNFAAAATNWLTTHIQALGERSALAIDQNAGLQWFLYGKSSVSSPAIAARPEAFIFHFRNRTFAEVFLVQRVTPVVATGARIPRPLDDFGDALKLELIEERAFAPLYLVRISRVLSVDDAKLLAWAKDRRDHPLPAAETSPSLSSEQDLELLDWLRQLP